MYSWGKVGFPPLFVRNTPRVCYRSTHENNSPDVLDKPRHRAPRDACWSVVPRWVPRKAREKYGTRR